MLSDIAQEGDSGGPVTHWNVTTGLATQAFKAKGQDQIAGWSQNRDGTYSPQLIPVTDATYSLDHQQYFSADATTHLYGVYDAATHALIHQIGDSNSFFTSASFSPDGRLLAIGGPFQQAQIWDTQTWQVVATLRYPAPAVAFSPDGKWLAASRSWDIDLWSVADLLAWGKPVF